MHTFHQRILIPNCLESKGERKGLCILTLTHLLFFFSGYFSSVVEPTDAEPWIQGPTAFCVWAYDLAKLTHN